MMSGCCSCLGGKHDEEEEDVFAGTKCDEKEHFNDGSVSVNADITIDHEEEEVEENEYAFSVQEQEEYNSPEEEKLIQNGPERVVTESLFEKPGKKKQLKKILTKIKNPVRKVSFAKNESEKMSLVGSEDSGYGTTLATIHRANSMESFVSSLSTATTGNIEGLVDEGFPSRLQIVIQYHQKCWVLAIGVQQGESLVNISKKLMYWQVHMTLLPFKKHRFKTRYKSSSTPIFNQSFEVKNISIQALDQLAVRYRVYGRTRKTGQKKLAGELIVSLEEIAKIPERLISEWRLLKTANNNLIVEKLVTQSQEYDDQDYSLTDLEI